MIEEKFPERLIKYLAVNAVKGGLLKIEWMSVISHIVATLGPPVTARL